MISPAHSDPKDLETIARSGGTIRRMAARVPTYLTDVRENPAWLPMFLLARLMPFRKAHWLTARRVLQDKSATPSIFGDLQAEAIAAELRRTGIFTGLTLPRPIQEEIARFGHETPCFGNFERRLEFLAGDHAEAERHFGRTILSGHHYERILQCAAALAVQRDPLLLNVARHYLGGEARLITTRTWWSFPARNASEADLSRASFKFHFDLDDWRMLKFFFYLTDVDATSGPHVYVRGSHNRRRLKHQLTLLVGHAADEVLTFYGEENAITLTGKAGSGFVEDPFGFHMGTLAKEKPRLMMEVGFGVSKPSKRRYHGEPVVR
ncbi:phytanoyl-CoA dioxygenase family protein [Sinorhizobium meliloti]|uniref:phytanoyl-CoA dioxygenase family protein n=1 Tax=Rhizobium meliloti TaxID=382 RepID=UPI0003A4C068|nr:phytanoyl-CoA dioxygenase family protein [Sinorhizobium meliloti]